MLRLKNPLSFPGGNPGVNQSHPAASGLMFSAVPTATGTATNLVTGSSATTGSAPTATIWGGLGPANYFSAAGNYLTIAGLQTAIFKQGTLAAFFTITTTSTNVILGQVPSSGTGVILLGNSGTLVLQTNGVIYSAGYALALNTPYFVAVSFSGTSCNVVLLNLKTGVVLYKNITIVIPTGTFSGSMALGNYSAHLASLLGNLGPCMGATCFLSLPQLIQWAQTPWDFWYPRTFDGIFLSGLKKAVPAHFSRGFPDGGVQVT